jgi:hypothetical protein
VSRIDILSAGVANVSFDSMTGGSSGSTINGCFWTFPELPMPLIADDSPVYLLTEMDEAKKNNDKAMEPPIKIAAMLGPFFCWFRTRTMKISYNDA